MIYLIDAFGNSLQNPVLTIVRLKWLALLS